MKPATATASYDYAAVASPRATASTPPDEDDDGKAVASSTPPLVPLAQLFAFADATDAALVAVGAIAALAAGLSHPLQIVLLGDMLDAFHPDASSSFQRDVDRVARNFAVVGAATAVCCFLQVACWSLAASRQAVRIRQAYLHALLTQPMGWFDVRDHLQLAARASDATAVIQDGMGRKLGEALHLTSLAVSGVVIGLVKGWELTLVLLACTPFIAAAASLMVKTTATATQSGLDSYAKAGAVALEALRNIRTVHTLNAQRHFGGKYESALSVATRAGITKHVAVGAGTGVMLFLIFCTYAGGMFYGALKIANARRDGCVDYDACYSGGRVVTVFFSVIMGAMALGQAGPSAEAVVSARTAAVDVFAVIHAKSDIDPCDPHSGLKPGSVQGRIKIDQVSFAYPSRPDALVCRDYSLTIEAGETVALVGASGSGKSTVVALLERFYDPISGVVELDGRDVRSLNVQWLRQQIALVSQTPVLFATSIMENIRYGRPEATDEQVMEAAKMANAFEFVMEFPLGFETVVGERGAQLSGGQKQRIAIARAVLKNAPILVLDEATSALDAESESLVQASLNELFQVSTRTTIIVAHRLSTIRAADRIAVHKNGSIVEIGSHDQLMQMPLGVYRQLVENEERSPGKRNGPPHAVASSTNEYTIPDTAAHLSLYQEASPNIVKPTQDGKTEPFDGELVPVSRVWKQSLQDWKYMVLGVFGAVVNAAVFPVWGVLLTKIVVLFFDERPRHELLTTARYWSLGFVALGVVFGVSIVVQHFGFAVAAQRLVARIRQSAFDSMLRQDAAWFDRPENSSGALVSRLSTDSAVLQSMTADALNQSLVTITALVIAFSIALTRSWEMTLLILATAPILIFMSTVQARVMSGTMNNKSLVDPDVAAGSLMVEAVGSIRTVVSLGLEDIVERRYGSLLKRSSVSDRKRSVLGGIAFGGSEGSMFFATALLFYSGGKWVSSGRITFEDMLMVIMVIMLSMVGVGQAAQHAVDQTKAREAASRVFEIIDRTPEINVSEHEGETLQHVAGHIEFKSVNFAYPSRPHALVYKDFNLRITAGQTVALVGTSGSGKSTAISLLERFCDPTDGSVALDGADLRTLCLPWLRDQMALVSQQPVLFSGSIAENIALGRPGASLSDIMEAAKQANAYDFIVQFPDGFDTRVGDDGAQVSGGQRQRIAIARAILRDSKVILLDEATSALDNESERVVQEALEKLVATKACTTIVVAHKLSTVRHADLIAVVKDGRIVELGNHEELLAASDSVYKSLVARQMA